MKKFFISVCIIFTLFTSPVFASTSASPSLLDSLYAQLLTLSSYIQHLRSTTQTAALSGAGSGLVGYWTFDEGSGTVANDSSGSGNTGTLNGAGWGMGKINQALTLNGSSASVVTSSVLSGSEMTVSAWVNPSLGYGHIIDKRETWGMSWDLFLSGGSLKFGLVTTNGSNADVTVTSNTTVPSSVWSLVTAVYSGSTNSIKLYINGVQSGTGSMSGNVYNPSNLVTIGVDNRASPSDYFSGSLDDVRIYNRALTAQEVTDLYNLNTGGGTPPTPDTQAPTTPTSLTATAVSSTAVNLTWTASTDNTAVTGYKIYRAGVQVGTSATTLYSDTGLTQNTTYSYTVSAYDAVPNTSTQSSPASVTTPITVVDTTAPIISLITPSSITSSSAIITYTTNELSDTQVEYGLTTSYGNLTTLNSSLVTSHSQTLSSLSANTLYHYRVKSKDASGNLATSGDSTFTTLVQSVSSGGLYYVDFASGSDANSGTTKTSAWKHAPGDVNATGNAIKTLQPGDTVFFKGGTVYSGRIVLGQSGNANGYITYATDPSWGVGKAILDGTASGASSDFSLTTAVSMTNISYVKLQNFEIRNYNVDHTLSWVWWGGGGIGVTGGTNIEISGNYVNKIDDYATNLSNAHGTGIGIGGGAAHVKIFNNEITEIGHTAIYIGGPLTDVEVYNNDLHNYIVWGMDIVSAQGPLSNINIHDNKIHDFVEYEGYGPHMDSIIIRDHQDSTQVLGMTNIVVDKNLFYNTNPNASAGGATAYIFLTDNSQNTTISNNVFLNTHAYSDIVVGWYSKNVSVLNNTITSTVSSEGTNIVIKNNIMLALSINMDHTQLNTFTINNNLYTGGVQTDHSVVVFLRNGSSAETFPIASWQAYSGNLYDQNSKYTLDPKLVNISTLDAHLQSTSPAIDSGANLSSLFTTDRDGVSRPQGSVWDIGAYEYTGGTVITPPTTDTITPTVSITSPTSLSTVSGSSVTLLASASDDTAVFGVQFKLDSSPLGQELTTAPYSGVWNTVGISNGVHTLQAVARDLAGNRATSTISITVSNTTSVIPPQGGGSSGGGGGSQSSTGTLTPTVSQTPAPTTSQTLSPFTHTLSLGSTGDDVKALQVYLNQQGYLIASTGVGSKGQESTYFGDKTRLALIRYQVANSLPPTGQVDATTLAHLKTKVTSSSLTKAQLIAQLIAQIAYLQSEIQKILAQRAQTSVVTPPCCKTVSLPSSYTTQIADLETKLNTLRSSVSIPLFTRSLSVGMTGDDVTRLRTLLSSEGFTTTDSSSDSSTFTTNLKTALAKFQEYHRDTILAPNNFLRGEGGFGPSTRQAINDMITIQALPQDKATLMKSYVDQQNVLKLKALGK